MSGGAQRSGWRGLVIPVGLVAAAEAAARATGWESTALATPSAIAVAFWGALIDGTVESATLATLATALGGLAIGAGLAVPLGVALGLMRTADRLMEFSIEALRPIPAVALIPLALRGVAYKPMGALAVLQRNLLIYGFGGIVVPFIGIKAIDMAITALGLV